MRNCFQRVRALDRLRTTTLDPFLSLSLRSRRLQGRCDSVKGCGYTASNMAKGGEGESDTVKAPLFLQNYLTLSPQGL